ncbi:MAG: universal stress protein [Pseudomonadota bacterium]
MANTLHTITLPVRGDGKGDNVFAHAAHIAHRFAAHVKVLHCHPSPQDFMPFGVAVPGVVRAQIEEAAKNQAENEAQSLRAEFRTLAATLGLPESAPGSGKASASFVEYTGKQIDAVRTHGRLVDLICVPQPDSRLNLGANTLKAALFSSGRPVMMCPEREGPIESIGKTITIGWNGSMEATRAVVNAMPFLTRADSVTILTTGATPHAASAEDLQAYLALRDTTAYINRFETNDNIGKALLEKSSELGSDLLVMGAYHDSYERETLFGGNTQAVVEQAAFPVLFVH